MYINLTQHTYLYFYIYSSASSAFSQQTHWNQFTILKTLYHKILQYPYRNPLYSTHITTPEYNFTTFSNHLQTHHIHLDKLFNTKHHSTRPRDDVQPNGSLSLYDRCENFCDKCLNFRFYGNTGLSHTNLAETVKFSNPWRVNSTSQLQELEIPNSLALWNDITMRCTAWKQCFPFHNFF